MKKIFNALIYVVLLFIVLIILWAFWFAANFHGENFKYSEKYTIDLPIDSIVQRIRIYKRHHPSFRQYDTGKDNTLKEYGYFTEIGIGEANIMTDSQTYKSTWYDCEFYIKENDAVVGCCIKLNQIPTELFLVDVSYSNTKSKSINKFDEISRKENKKVKNEFETEILGKIFYGKWKHKDILWFL